MNKIYDINRLAKTINWHKNTSGRKIVLCHGCFDFLHIGHIKYFQAAKRMGDILVVTLTPDIYIDKGPNRPYFNQTLRSEAISALECVDYVAINNYPTAEETLRLLKPNIYVKGQEFENLQDDKIKKEYAVVKELDIEMRFTHEVMFSSTKIIQELE